MYMYVHMAIQFFFWSLHCILYKTQAGSKQQYFIQSFALLYNKAIHCFQQRIKCHIIIIQDNSFTK